MKYMVLECHPGYAVVLDEAGSFLKVANRQYKVGQMVTDVLPMQVPPQKKHRKWRYSLAAMAACLVLVLGLTLPGMQQPYASVYVKINPEVRIDVDKQDMVVNLEGVNQDGVLLLDGYDFQEKDLNLVTYELVDRAINMGYLQADGQITISLDSQDQIWVDDHTQSLHSHLQTHLQEKLEVTIQIQTHHDGDHNSGHYDDNHENNEVQETLSTQAVTESHRDDGHDDDHSRGGHDDHEG